MADDAILDVSDFAQRHPGGRRLILNAVGTDVTQELIGRDQSVGHAMAFSPHVHSGVSTDVEQYIAKIACLRSSLFVRFWFDDGIQPKPR